MRDDLPIVQRPSAGTPNRLDVECMDEPGANGPPPAPDPSILFYDYLHGEFFLLFRPIIEPPLASSSTDDIFVGLFLFPQLRKSTTLMRFMNILGFSFLFLSGCKFTL